MICPQISQIYTDLLLFVIPSEVEGPLESRSYSPD